jgi:hypothetical protein
MNNPFTPDEAVEFGNELLNDIMSIREKCEVGELPISAHEFAEEVEALVEGIVEWVDSESHVTKKQENSLRNVRYGVDKWLDR